MQTVGHPIRIVSIRKVSGWIVCAVRLCRFMAQRKRAAQARVLNDDEAPAEKDEELVALGRRLLALREAAGLTQEGLAHAAGLHWTYVGQVERGERNLSYKNVQRLARGLGVEPALLVQDEPPER